MFFRNVCVVALVVLCGHAASAFTMSMVMGMANKLGSQALSLGMTCLEKNKATDVITNPSPANIVRGCGCLSGCAMQMVGLMKPDGTINSDKIMNAIPASMPMADKLKQIVTDCSAKGGDPCHAPLTWFKCICTDGPMKSIIESGKQLISALLMEVMKAAV